MRITKSHLEGKVRTVNTLLGHGENPAYSTPGAITLYMAYGGYGVHRYSEHGRGAVSDLMGGCQTARECGRFLDGMIATLYELRDRDSR